MITGVEIINQVVNERIKLEPFDVKRVGPNSYDVSLASTLYRLKLPSEGSSCVTSSLMRQCLDVYYEPEYEKIVLDDSGFILQPGQLYLGVTQEFSHTPHHIPCYEGRSTLARYGVQSHQTAGFGDIDYAGHWTLELTVTLPVRIYPGIRIGQLYFDEPTGNTSNQYRGHYAYEQYTENPKPKLPVPGNV